MKTNTKLVQAGCDPKLASKQDGATPLHLVQLRTYAMPHMPPRLLLTGADKRLLVVLLCLKAAVSGSVECLTILLDAQVAIDAEDLAGLTAMHVAAGSGHPAVCMRNLRHTCTLEQQCKSASLVLSSFLA